MATFYRASSSFSSHIPIKDTSRIVSINEVEFLRTCASQNLRVDGRRFDELRPCRLFLARASSSSTSAAAVHQSTPPLISEEDNNGITNANNIHANNSMNSNDGNTSTATVQWGARTRVTCTVSGELVPPMDRPNEGIMQLSVDLSPGASAQFRQSAPISTASGRATSGTGASTGNILPESFQKSMTVHILRNLERIIFAGGALDTESLCVVPGRWVWKIQATVTVVDAAGGNMMDAAVMSCVAALRHYRRPHVQMSFPSSDDDHPEQDFLWGIPSLIPSDWKEPDPLPLHHTPLSMSFGLIDCKKGSSGSVKGASPLSASVAILGDPSDREEMVASGSITLAGNVHGELLLMDYLGGCEITIEALRSCHDIAAKQIPTLCHLLEESLEAADQQWRMERLNRLQRLEHVDLMLPPPPPAMKEEANDYVATHQLEQRISAAEEAYRLQALDYNHGHAPVQVRENDDTNATRRSSNTSSSNLFAFLLQSAATQQTSLSSSLPQSQPGKADRVDSPPLPVEYARSSSVLTTTALSAVAAHAHPFAATAHTLAATDHTLSDADAGDSPHNVHSNFFSISDDEDDVLTTVKNEIQKAAAEAVAARPVEPTANFGIDKGMDVNDDDDLAAAIITKSKKKRSKQKSR